MAGSRAGSRAARGNDLEVPGGVVTGVRITQANSSSKATTLDGLRGDSQMARAGGGGQRKSPPQTRMAQRPAHQDPSRRGSGPSGDGGRGSIYTANVGTDPRAIEDAARPEARRPADLWPGTYFSGQDESRSRPPGAQLLQGERGKPGKTLGRGKDDARGLLMVTNKILQPKGTPSSRG